MTRERKLILGIVAAVVVIAVGIWGYNFMFGATTEVSEPISSVPLELPTDPTAEPTALPTVEPTVAPTEQPSPTAEPEVESELADPTTVPDPTATLEPTATPEPVLRLFEIRQEGSEVRFTLGEILAGQPNTVIGVTDQVAGQIAVDLDQLQATQLGVIQINARTLMTDNEFRNRSIRTRILQTDDYEFITFTPTAIEGLPDSTTIGETVSFQVVGELTIRDVTQLVAFDVNVTPVSETELSGLGATTVMRADFDLVIPSVEDVADVEEAVLLEIEFVATAVDAG
jgi:polyisoprenoid-binding protein YceI